MSIPQIRCPSCQTSMSYTAAACPNCGLRMVSVKRTTKSIQNTSLEIYEGTPYSECRAQNCVFNVTQQDESCPNCGIESPYRMRDSFELATALSSSWAGCYVIISIILLAIVINLIAVNMVGKTENAGLLVTITTTISLAIPSTAGKRDVEVFNAQVAITDFSHSFAELEAEYTRLQSEGDVAREIGRILQKIEPD